ANELLLFTALTPQNCLHTVTDLPISSQLLLQYHPHHYFLTPEHFSCSEGPRQTNPAMPPTPGSCYGGNHGGNNPGPMGNTASHLCCSADNEFSHVSAPCCGGDLENEACATDFTARLCLSQP
ncbi:hypothetical protein N310_02061, partial [Acanthisitta chloris]